MGKSLADQLLGAGLVDEKKVKKARQEKRKVHKQLRSGVAVEVDNSAERIAADKAAQVERDKALNLERQQREQQKAMRAQALQMLEQHELSCEGDVTFNFVDPHTNKVKQVLVDARTQKHLSQANLAICLLRERYIVVPRNIAEKAAERFADVLIYIAPDHDQQVDEDDPYKDYQIPDDLMW